MENKYDEKDALKAAQIIFKKSKIAKKLNRGYSHDIYEVETNESPAKAIIRFSNKNPRENCLEKEIRVNQILKKIGIPVPEILLHDKTKKIIPYEFVIMAELEGEDLDQLWDNLPENEKIDILEKIGEILGRIHKVKFKHFGILLPKGIKKKADFSLKMEGDKIEMNPSTLDIFVDTFEWIGTLATFSIINPEFILDLTKYILDKRKLTETNEKPALTHGDFYTQNFKVKRINNEWIITGLLDFEYGAAKIKEYDFVKLHREGILEKDSQREALLKGYKKYQKIDQDFDKKIDFFRTCRDIGFASYLLKAGRLEKAQEVLGKVKKKIGFEKDVFM